VYSFDVVVRLGQGNVLGEDVGIVAAGEGLSPNSQGYVYLELPQGEKLSSTITPLYLPAHMTVWDQTPNQTFTCERAGSQDWPIMTTGGA
jgi:hypothetical protein